ncbi:hypothetical protein PR202_ga18885 [Eleusine coracana subsp. coracana]|uniref:Uncharacterized protein n=1 Tax=Eleusine coracana subsp. coracana TaxID=191504 RepID=A0AAV5CU45_ELECO|nr:hypothetical protein PR202_ga18885 [Eleusine coracana subsp. coracana]
MLLLINDVSGPWTGRQGKAARLSNGLGGRSAAVGCECSGGLHAVTMCCIAPQLRVDPLRSSALANNFRLGKSEIVGVARWEAEGGEADNVA